MAPTNNRRKLPILIIIFIVLVGLAISMIESKYDSGLEAAAVTYKTTDAAIADNLKAGKSTQVWSDEKTNAAMREAMTSAFNQAGVMPNSYMYYCRNNGESTGTLYSTEINQPWIITESSTCVQVGF